MLSEAEDRGNLRRELPRIPYVTTGAKALDNLPPDAGLKPGSSTELTSGTAREVAAVAGTAVEERPFKGRAKNRKKENNSTLPKAAVARSLSRVIRQDGITTLIRHPGRAPQWALGSHHDEPS